MKLADYFQENIKAEKQYGKWKIPSEALMPLQWILNI